mmetsp:Transcript_6181/g.13199  ORF Transcript_6181/g.13199 Transcript_6181/m.13199 type:complete len:82 (-) Transcript_6181:79-324(-)
MRQGRRSRNFWCSGVSTRCLEGSARGLSREKKVQEMADAEILSFTRLLAQKVSFLRVLSALGFWMCVTVLNSLGISVSWLT